MLCMVRCFAVTEESFPNEEEEKIWLEFKEFDKGTICILFFSSLFVLMSIHI